MGALSFRGRVAIAFAILVAASSVIFGMVAAHQATQEVEREIGTNLASLAEAVVDKLDRAMWSRKGEIATLAAVGGLGDARTSQDQLRRVLNRLKAALPVYSWVGLTAPDGQVLAATDGILEGQSIATRPVYLEGLKGSFVGDVHDAVLLAKLLPNPSGEPMKFVDVAARVEAPDGSRLGVLAAHLSWTWAEEVVATTLTPVADSRQVDLFVIAADGTVLLGPRKALMGSKLALTAVERARRGETGAAVETWPDGKAYLTGFAFGNGYQDFTGLGWTVLARQPVAEAFAPAESLRLAVFGWGALLTVVMAGAGWLAAHRLTAPVATLTDAADRLRRGRSRDIPVLPGPPEITRLSAALHDLVATLTHQEQALDAMTDLALVDRLTGLPNRLAFESGLERTAAAAGRENKPFALLYLDLDGFKPVNDTHGHDAGDAVLRAVGDRLRASLRGGDMAARLGGDEFVMLLAPGATVEITRRVAQRVIDSLGEPVTFNDTAVRIGCSVGGALWLPDGGESLDDLLRRADQALYAAKRGGKNRVELAV